MSRTKIKSSDISDAITIQNLTVTGSLLDSAGDPITGGVTEYATIDDLPLTGVSNGAMAFVNDTNYLYIWADTGWYQIGTINTDPSITGGYSASYSLAKDATGDTPPTGGGKATVVTLVGSDPEGIPITWSYEVTAGSLGSGSTTVATVSQAENVFTITPYLTPGTFTITWKASDGVNIGTAVSAFSLAFQIADSNYTALLVKAEATGDNATFIDSGDNTLTITKNGDVTQGTFSPYSREDGAWSNYFDGTGDYLTTNYMLPATASFTIEAWIFPQGSWGAEHSILGQYQSVVGGRSWFGVSTTGKLRYWVGADGAVEYSTVLPLNTWSHVAMVKNGTTVTLYVNGIGEVGSVVYDTGIVQVNAAVGTEASGGIPWVGYIADLRVTESAASSITVPTSPPSTTGTALATCRSNRFVDKSTNGYTITPAGNVAVSAFGPFDHAEYDPAVNGGSAYFDGAGDYLTFTDSGALRALGANDFTVDMWVYLNAVQTSHLFDTRPVSTNGAYPLVYLNNNAVTYYVNTSSRIVGATLPTSAWQHVALVRSSGTTRLYINGVQSGSDYIDGNTYLCPNDRPNIGGAGYTLGTYSLNGCISGFRVIVGTAIDFSSTGVPTAPVSGTGTELTLNCTNADILDYSGGSNLRLFGNTAVSTTTKKNAAASLYFDGSGDYLTVPASPDFAFGTGDFTVEAWVYSPDNTRKALFESRSAPTSTAGYAFICEDYIRFYSNGWKISSAAMPTNQWVYVAWVRKNGTLYFYLNGQQDTTTYALTNNFTDPLTYTPKICGSSSSGEEWIGYVEDIRITKGLARYNGNFTPPSEPLLG